MSDSIPIIDITALGNGVTDAERAVAREIGAACRGIGFFYITGHRIAPETLASVFRQAQQFFTSPASMKEQARFSGPADNRGFISLGGESLDPTKPPDVKEAFNIGLELAPDDPDSPSARSIAGRMCRSFARPCSIISIGCGRSE